MSIHDILRRVKVDEPLEGLARSELIRSKMERLEALGRLLWEARKARAQYCGWKIRAQSEGREDEEAWFTARERQVHEQTVRVIGDLAEEALGVVTIALGSNVDPSNEARPQVNLARAAFLEAALSLIDWKKPESRGYNARRKT